MREAEGLRDIARFERQTGKNMGAILIDSLTDSVKQGLQHPSKCSNTTVTTLRQLLTGTTIDEKPRETKSAKRNPACPAPSKPVRTVRLRAAAKDPVPRRTPKERDAPILSQQEKLVLATEVFNIASKLLSEQIKKTSGPRITKISSGNGRQRARNQDISKQPLQSASPNSKIQSSDDTNGALAESVKAHGKCRISVIAECAILSLKTLWNIRVSEDGFDPASSHLSQGLSILIGKLLYFGLQDLAIKGLWMLKLAIQVAIDATHANRDPTLLRDSSIVQSAPLESLLEFRDMPKSGCILQIYISFQSYALKVLTLDGNACTIHKALPYLRWGNPSSPANAIIAAHNMGIITDDKAAQQLQAHSQNLMALATVLASDEDKQAQSKQLDPTVPLLLQFLALEIRCIWWKIIGHDCDEEKELWGPLSRFVTTYARCCPNSKKRECDAIHDAFTQLSVRLRSDGLVNEKSESKCAFLATVLKTLSQIAYSAGRLEIATELCEASAASFRDERPIQHAIYLCRYAFLNIATLKLQSKNAIKVLKAVDEAAVSLTAPIKGSQTELDELLMESALLKKALMKFLSNTHTSLKEGLAESDAHKINNSSLIYLSSFVRFIVRYLTPAVQAVRAENVDALSQILHKCESIALAAIDSVIAVGKLPSGDAALAWLKAEPLLPACISICQTIREISPLYESEGDAGASASTRILRISNMYWSTYMRYKSLGKGSEELLLPVDQAINALRHCTLSDQISGLLPIKYERQAALYAELGMKSRSSAAYLSAINSHLAAGVLDTASQMLSLKHPRHVWKDPEGPAYALGRVIGSYIKDQIRYKLPSDSIIYDNEDLAPCLRATLLEQQATIIMDSPQLIMSDMITKILPTLISNLLSLLPWKSFPIRHLRIIHQALRFLLEHSSRFDKSFSDFLLAEAARCVISTAAPSEDKELLPFQNDLQASLIISIEFFSDAPSTEALENAIHSWVAILQECESWEAVQARIGDPPTLMSQLRSLSDYLGVQGLWKLRMSALAAISQLLALQKTPDYSGAVECYSSISLLYSQLGYADEASHILTKAKAICDQQEVLPHVLLSWHLSSAEYNLQLGDCITSIEIIRQAQTLFDDILSDISNQSSQVRVAIERLATDAATLLSRSFAAKGEPNQAAYYAKRAVKLSCRSWVRLEKSIEAKLEQPGRSKASIGAGSITEGMAALDLSTGDKKPSKSHLEGAMYWSQFTSHVAALLQLARISDHNGSFQDAVYYGEQALGVCVAVGAKILTGLVEGELGDRFIRGNRTHKGVELLEKVHSNGPKSLDSIESILLNLYAASLYAYREETDSACRVLSESMQALNSLTSSMDVGSINPFKDSVEELVNQTKKLSIKYTEGPIADLPTHQPRPRNLRKKRQIKEPVSLIKEDTAVKHEHSQRQTPTTRLHNELLMRQAMLLLSSHQFSGVTELLEQAGEDLSGETAILAHNLCRAHHMFGVAIQEFATHSVYCVLPESTISLPALQLTNRISKATSTKSKSSLKKAAAITKPPKSTSGIGSSLESLSHMAQNISEALTTARQVLADISSSIYQRGSSKEGHEASYLAGRTTMLAFATGSFSNVETKSSVAVQSIELGRNSALLREHLSIASDKDLSDNMSRLDWPPHPPAHLVSKPVSEDCFIKNYVDNLPLEWDVLSITLCPSQDEFIISKIRSGQSPFILRLPLKRGGEDDLDEETFSFQDGKTELLEIIRLANESAHNTKSCVGKEEKKKWWANRENLDTQLKNLLQNIETVWFGGFRGIFSQAQRNENLLKKFIASFNKILDSHLPSRREKRGGARVNFPAFDLWVMELFVNIGSLADESDPEDAVMDLLYFVVDILQFHGETNAYDEIDFDMMVVKTLDALRAYAEEEKQERDPSQSRHTILILDRSLHAFPWESMECLQHSSVSRMPSLASVQEQVQRLKKSQEGVSDEGPFGFYANRNCGTYILNPGGDLKSTEATFKAPLLALEGWTGTVNIAPTEEDFEKSLQSKDIMLYFGHGSGAQYIRGRSVRRLGRCAVTFLMGCSSGSMTEAGDFEPYGIPWNYMHAGAPALVATLWDVTDKDIDRFASSVFQHWGLLPPTSSTHKKNRPAHINLNAAVADSRNSCILRYLNGAAPVVYGVPVFLK